MVDPHAAVPGRTAGTLTGRYLLVLSDELLADHDTARSAVAELTGLSEVTSSRDDTPGVHPTLFARLGVAVAELDLLPGMRSEEVPARLEALADALDAEAERCQPAHEPFVNPAKALALRLAERTPLLWGVDPAAAAVARHGALALATHAGVVAHADGLAQAGTLAGLRVAVDLSDLLGPDEDETTVEEIPATGVDGADDTADDAADTTADETSDKADAKA